LLCIAHAIQERFYLRLLDPVLPGLAEMCVRASGVFSLQAAFRSADGNPASVINNLGASL
jgi:hypothetical protein